MSTPRVRVKATTRLDQIHESYTLCRDLQHSWLPRDVRVDRTRREVHRIMTCERCPMQRTQVLLMDGTIKTNYYSGPKDYYLKGGHMTKAERAALRLRNAGLA